MKLLIILNIDTFKEIFKGNSVGIPRISRSDTLMLKNSLLFFNKVFVLQCKNNLFTLCTNTGAFIESIVDYRAIFPVWKYHPVLPCQVRRKSRLGNWMTNKTGKNAHKLRQCNMEILLWVILKAIMMTNLDNTEFYYCRSLCLPYFHIICTSSQLFN